MDRATCLSMPYKLASMACILPLILLPSPVSLLSFLRSIWVGPRRRGNLTTPEWLEVRYWKISG